MTRRSGLTMVEVLSSLVLVAVILSAGGRLFRDGWVALHRSIRHADAHQTVTLLMRRWQTAIGDTDPATWRADERSFRAGTLSVVQEGEQLVFSAGERVQASYGVGEQACNFGVERSPGAADRAILTVSMSRGPSRRPRVEDLRIVACGGAR